MESKEDIYVYHELAPDSESSCDITVILTNGQRIIIPRVRDSIAAYVYANIRHSEPVKALGGNNTPKHEFYFGNNYVQ